MNAVTTAEYVVLETTLPDDMQMEINKYAKQGYKLVSYSPVFDDSNRAVLYTAVMMRESTHTSALAERVTAMAEDVISLEKRIEEIEAKIDWSK